MNVDKYPVVAISADVDVVTGKCKLLAYPGATGGVVVARASKRTTRFDNAVAVAKQAMRAGITIRELRKRLKRAE